MSHAQQQIIDMAPQLSDKDAYLIADFMNRLIVLGNATNVTDSNEKIIAF